MKTGNKIIVLILAALLPMGTSAQKKSKLQKRDRYEFSFDLPTYVEQLKTELT